MNYEEMSDHDINMAVTCIAKNLQGWEVSESNISFYHCGIDGNGFFEVNVIDYCNNPDDAWPIIVENGICITSPVNGTRSNKWAASWNEDGGRWSSGDVVASDYNPLRAAMIVFLKMNKEAK